MREHYERLLEDSGLLEQLDPHGVFETHLSVVFVGHQYSIKFKKPVVFQFANFSSLEQRWIFCCQELLHNRRFSNDLYLGLVAFDDAQIEDVTQALLVPGPFQERSAGGRAVQEVAVLMRTILPDEFLTQRLVKGTWSEDLEHKLVAKIVACHRDAIGQYRRTQECGEGGLERAANENVIAIDAWIAKNPLQTIAPTLRWMLTYLSEYQASHLARTSEKRRQRAANGLVAEVHGDLRAEHICYRSGQIEFFDGVEFSAALRTLDVLNDFSFLYAELRFLGYFELGRRLRDDYAIQCEYMDPDLLSLYATYHLMTRAKVELIVSTEASIERAFRYAALSMRETLGESQREPLILVVAGFMGVGKSTLARALSVLLAAPHLETDVLRSEIVGRDSAAGYGMGIYSDAHRHDVYLELARRAAESLKAESLAVCDGSFCDVAHRDRIREVAREHGARVQFFWCELTREQALERLTERAAAGESSSDGRAELYDLQVQQFLPFEPREVDVAKIDMSKSETELWSAALEIIRSSTARFPTT